MKKLIKITTICSLLIIACLLISACGGGTEQLARNQGDVLITVTNSSSVPLTGVTVQERQTAGTGAFTPLGSTNASGQLRFTGTAGTTYFFTISMAGFTTQTDLASTPQLTSTVNLNVVLL
jgi:hypothetical protein